MKWQPIRHRRAPLRDHGRTIVRAARAEIRRAHRFLLDFGERGLRAAEPRHRFGELLVRMEFQQPLADAIPMFVGIERGLDRKQPLAGLVALADADRLRRRAIEFPRGVAFRSASAFFFDDDDELQPAREFTQPRSARAPDAADLEYPEAQRIAARFVDAEIRRAPGARRDRFTCRDDADLGLGPPEMMVRLSCWRRRSDDRVALVLLQARLLLEHAVRGPYISTPGGRIWSVGVTAGRDRAKVSTTAVDSIVSLMHLIPTQTLA